MVCGGFKPSVAGFGEDGSFCCEKASGLIELESWLLPSVSSSQEAGEKAQRAGHRLHKPEDLSLVPATHGGSRHGAVCCLQLSTAGHSKKTLLLAGYHPSSRFSERLCLKGVHWRLMEQGTDV